jgi:nucleoside-diphosphate-sugar epimerase
MRVLVTGATGFLGRRLVSQLLEQGMHVRCLVRPTSDVAVLRQGVAAEHEERLEFREGNLGRPGSCDGALDDCEVVYHLAAALRGATAIMFTNNVIATRQLIDLASRADVRRFVLVSSIAVYGTGHLRAGDVLDESCPLDPQPHRRDSYTYSKIVQERVAWEAHQQGRISLVVVRPGVIYGPGRDCITSRVGFRLGNVVVRMGGRQQLPYTYVDNCAEAIGRAGLESCPSGEAFNIVDDDLPTGRSLLKRYRAEVKRLRVLPVPRWGITPLSRLCEWYHKKSQGLLPAILTPYKSRAQWHPLRYSNVKAHSLLGWQPRVTTEEGLTRTFAWLRQQEGSRQEPKQPVPANPSIRTAPPPAYSCR